MRTLALLVAALLTAVAATAAPTERARVVRTYPHDRGAFTEGLFYRDGYLYEATGQIGASSIRKVELKTGRVVRSVPIPPPFFGEGIAPLANGQIASLTWQQHIGFRWTLDGFRRVGTFRYAGEGWALTSTGKAIVMSDGTPTLRFLDPATLAERRHVTVTDDGKPVTMVNELEYVDGEILANIWMTNRIARIDPATGDVLGWIDVSALTAQSRPINTDAVPNGIAWDAQHRRLFVTGKYWPLLFEIAPPKRH